ncbi:unnamed protein product [Dicrocoelium dendriticum]|nr:unnamed protein product [Dicrocoelium dendriticum]
MGGKPASCGNSENPCSVAFANFLKEKLVIVACVAFGVCVLQLLSIIIAFCLGNRIQNYENI